MNNRMGFERSFCSIQATISRITLRKTKSDLISIHFHKKKEKTKSDIKSICISDRWKKIRTIYRSILLSNKSLIYKTDNKTNQSEILLSSDCTMFIGD